MKSHWAKPYFQWINHARSVRFFHPGYWNYRCKFYISQLIKTFSLQYEQGRTALFCQSSQHNFTQTRKSLKYGAFPLHILMSDTEHHTPKHHYSHWNTHGDNFSSTSIITYICRRYSKWQYNTKKFLCLQYSHPTSTGSERVHLVSSLVKVYVLSAAMSGLTFARIADSGSHRICGILGYTYGSEGPWGWSIFTFIKRYCNWQTANTKTTRNYHTCMSQILWCLPIPSCLLAY